MKIIDSKWRPEMLASLFTAFLYLTNAGQRHLLAQVCAVYVSKCNYSRPGVSFNCLNRELRDITFSFFGF